MAFPKQSEVEIPLLQVLLENGGSAKPKEVYPKVTAFFPELTADEQEQRLESSPSTRKWWNLIQWVRQDLVEIGEIDGTTRGVWTITDVGRARLAALPKATIKLGSTKIQELTLRDLSNRSRDDAKARLLSELKQLTATGFEHFCMELLQQLGYRNVAVTKRSGDGGIDGYGDFRQGAVSIKSAFQAKRWADNPVRRPDIDKLRGAIQGDYDHGVFITTSRFTKDAQDASYKKGAITILLLDGEALAELMLDRGIGIVKQPVYLYEIVSEFFQFDQEESG
jgi:restriction endonuclease Mrr